jgi:hypothetical protein
MVVRWIGSVAPLLQWQVLALVGLGQWADRTKSGRTLVTVEGGCAEDSAGGRKRRVGRRIDRWRSGLYTKLIECRGSSVVERRPEKAFQAPFVLP